jgi:hypothetical protein
MFRFGRSDGPVGGLDYVLYGTGKTQGVDTILYHTRTSGKRGFYPPPLVPKLFGSGLKGALVPVRAAGARPRPSPGS